jgi:hypothetical protein
MKIVRQYKNAVEFEQGIDMERGKGWFVLDSWRMVAIASDSGYVIVAVFRGRG